MKSIIVAAGAIAGLSMLAGCAAGLREARQVEPTGSEFNQNLYSGYLGLAESEHAEGDHRDTDTFARRATRAGTGESVLPEEIGTRSLPGEHVDELTGARATLVKALDDGAAKKNPAGAAKAQVMFDCWMQEQEENWQPEDIARCRDGYYAAAKDLAPPATAAKPQKIRFIVYFPTDKAVLDGDAQQVISEARAAASKLGQPAVRVSGNADTVGAAEYNQVLSELRAQAVAKILATGDLPIDAVKTEAHGESRPAVETADETDEPRNRRVEITLQQ